MPDFSLVPVDHQPDFSDVSLVPVDHDPFSADDLIQQARAQLASQPQRLATSDAPSAINPQTGQLLHPPPAPPPPPPDPKLLAVPARAQLDQTQAAHQAQIAQQKAQNDAVHVQVKAQAEIALAKIKADLDSKMALFDAHLKAATEVQKLQRFPHRARGKPGTAIIIFRTRSGPENS
jgi:hypothetical protein